MLRGCLPRAFTGVLLVSSVALAGCGAAKPAKVHPSGGGPNAHIIMPSWLPANASEGPAVIAAKDFLLAFLYSEYKGGRDQRWTAYVSGGVIAGLRSTLATPGITTQSFKGTVRFSHMQAFPDPRVKGAIDVAECFDNSHSLNTSLATGKVVPDHTPADQHYYLNTDVLSRKAGWHVVSVYPVVYYPRARECRP